MVGIRGQRAAKYYGDDKVREGVRVCGNSQIGMGSVLDKPAYRAGGVCEHSISFCSAIEGWQAG